MSGMSDLNRQRIDRSKRRWVAAKLKTQDEGGDNKLYKVKVRSKGDRAMHVASFDEMSFKVDIKGAKIRWNGGVFNSEANYKKLWMGTSY